MRGATLTLVQVGRQPSRRKGRELLAHLEKQASHSMWGTSCTDTAALRRECFTFQRCGQNGAASRSAARFGDALSVVFADGDTFVGLLMGDMEGDALFVYNVCVDHRWRGRGLASQLFGWLARAHRGPVTLSVYMPTPSHFLGGRAAFVEASRRSGALLRMYARYGFRITKVEEDMVRMRAEELQNLPPLVGTPVSLA